MQQAGRGAENIFQDRATSGQRDSWKETSGDVFVTGGGMCKVQTSPSLAREAPVGARPLAMIGSQS